jgi:hypothetical protein
MQRQHTIVNRNRSLNVAPHRSSTNSLIAFGATLAVTEILPLPPQNINAIAVGSSPEYTAKSDRKTNQISSTTNITSHL